MTEITSELGAVYDVSYDDIMNSEPVDFSELTVQKVNKKSKDLVKQADAEAFGNAALHDLRVAYLHIEELEAKLRELEQENQTLMQEHDSDQSLLLQYDKLDEKGASMESVLSELEQTISALSLEHEQDKARIKELEKNIGSSEELDQLRDQLSTVSIERDSLKSELSVVKQELESTRSGVESLSNDVNMALMSFADTINNLN